MKLETKPELMIVVPVYNEQASARKVIIEWFYEIENWTENFSFFVINDGSTDKTLTILQHLQQKLGKRLEIYNQSNVGHGQSCLTGYREACRRDIPYIFQIDSDGQCDPQYFFRFWREREKYDVIYGHRIKRDDGWRRALASRILRLTLFLSHGVNCIDANSPYRLMRTQNLEKYLTRIPDDFHLANIALAVLLRKDAGSWRHAQIPMRFRERYGGEPSVALMNFGFRALELQKQIRSLLNATS